MKVYVIRHGVTEPNKKKLVNRAEDGLAPEGIEQARLAAAFVPKTIKHIYCSSMQRTKETAAIINETLKVPLTFHDELREVDFGLLSGTEFTDEMREKHRSLKYDWRVHKGEAFEDVKKRVLAISKVIKDSNSDGEVLIVTHGGVIRMLNYLEGNDLLDRIENTSLRSFDLDKIVK